MTDPRLTLTGRLRLHTDQTARATFGESEQWDKFDRDNVDHGANPTPAMLRTLADLLDFLPEPCTVDVMRDWEGCPVAIVDSGGYPAPFDVLALTESGRIGRGGINMPRYHNSLVAMLGADRN